MNKKLITFLLAILMPISITFAYTDKVYIGGENVGIEVKTNGVLVVGLYKVNDELLNSSNIQPGDYIIEVNNNKIVSIEDFVREINNDSDKEELDVKIKRKNKIFNTKLKLIYVENDYKTGLYVKDEISGIGTLSFIDPTNNNFFCLGHQIADQSTNEIVDISSGSIYYSYITDINRSSNGNVGEKEAITDENNKYGSIKKNTDKGIFGTYEKDYFNKKMYEVAKKEEVKIGNAKLLTVTKDDEIKEYSINIESIDLRDPSKNIMFSVTDKELIDNTGGIVQGMSGSPIIQNNKIIGVVTHVIINDTKRGYAIFTVNMLEEAEKE
jgi:stage IV sporulation protein B